VTYEGIKKQIDHLEWHLKYSKDSALDLIDNIIVNLQKLREGVV